MTCEIKMKKKQELLIKSRGNIISGMCLGIMDDDDRKMLDMFTGELGYNRCEVNNLIT